MRISALRACTVAILLGATLAPSTASGQAVQAGPYHSTRIGLSAGMGVNYHDARDIVDLINGMVLQRVDDFKSGVEFFGSVSVPLSNDWAAKVEYSYLLASYTARTAFDPGAEFTYALHMPTLIAQYILYEGPTYNFKAGAGVGYHFGSFDEKYGDVSRYTARGLGSLLELEGNTALGEDLYAHLGVQTRWEFVGDLTDGNGASPLRNAATTLHFFSVGARLGMTYYF